MQIYRSYGKRTFDVVVSAVALPLVAVIALFVAIAIKLHDGGPVLFLAERRGLRGQPFVMYKFRSMKVDSPDIRNLDGSTYAGYRDQRVTKIGRLIRMTSIDELPQLINVLKGDMSLVGPRPNMTGKPLDELNEVERRRLDVRPGITGLTQSLYRNGVAAEKKFQTDAYYVDHVSLPLDARVIARTVATVLTSKNVNSSDVELGAEGGTP